LAQTYRLTLPRRIANWLIRILLRLHVNLGPTVLLTVAGRRSGRSYSTPVYLIENDRQRWLVAPYGSVSWVRNARTAGWVELMRRGRSERVRIDELGPEEAAPVLKQYVRRVSIVRPYFDATPDDPPEAFAKEAHRHPVFRVL
jgi:deazaflavin-dependent oxidoreductase (nitroreductase family)